MSVAPIPAMPWWAYLLLVAAMALLGAWFARRGKKS